MPKVVELAWAAGFFDGEGCTYANYMKNEKTFPNVGVRIKIGQSGGESGRVILERFRDAVGVGRVTGPQRYAKSAHRTDVYTYHVQGAGAIEVLTKLEPYLSAPKRNQAAGVLTTAAMMHAIRACNPSFLRRRGVVRSVETNRKISEGVARAWRDPAKRERLTRGVLRSWEVRRHS